MFQQIQEEEGTDGGPEDQETVWLRDEQTAEMKEKHIVVCVRVLTLGVVRAHRGLTMMYVL